MLRGQEGASVVSRGHSGAKGSGNETLEVREVRKEQEGALGLKGQAGAVGQGGTGAASHSLSCTDTDESVTLVRRIPPGSVRFLVLCRKWTKRTPGPYWRNTCDTCVRKHRVRKACL